MDRKVGSLDVFENNRGNIAIVDRDNDWSVIEIDECMAEKVCKHILEVAKEIREHQNENK